MPPHAANRRRWAAGCRSNRRPCGRGCPWNLYVPLSSQTPAPLVLKTVDAHPVGQGASGCALMMVVVALCHTRQSRNPLRQRDIGQWQPPVHHIRGVTAQPGLGRHERPAGVQPIAGRILADRTGEGAQAVPGYSSLLGAAMAALYWSCACESVYCESDCGSAYCAAESSPSSVRSVRSNWRESMRTW